MKRALVHARRTLLLGLALDFLACAPSAASLSEGASAAAVERPEQANAVFVLPHCGSSDATPPTELSEIIECRDVDKLGGTLTSLGPASSFWITNRHVVEALREPAVTHMCLVYSRSREPNDSALCPRDRMDGALAVRCYPRRDLHAYVPGDPLSIVNSAGNLRSDFPPPDSDGVREVADLRFNDVAALGTPETPQQLRFAVLPAPYVVSDLGPADGEVLDVHTRLRSLFDTSSKRLPEVKSTHVTVVVPVAFDNVVLAFHLQRAGTSGMYRSNDDHLLEPGSSGSPLVRARSGSVHELAGVFQGGYVEYAGYLVDAVAMKKIQRGEGLDAVEGYLRTLDWKWHTQQLGISYSPDPRREELFDWFERREASNTIRASVSDLIDRYDAAIGGSRFSQYIWEQRAHGEELGDLEIVIYAFRRLDRQAGLQLGTSLGDWLSTFIH